MLGPYALGSVVLEAQRGDADPWRALAPLVSARPAARHARLCVADSKVLFDRTPLGSTRLERTARAFAACAGAAPWRFEAAERPAWAARLVDAALWTDEETLRRDRDELADALERAGLRIVHAQAVLVGERELNRAFAATGSKSRAVWSYVARELRALWDEHGARAPRAVLDRQGGRTRYAPLLNALFPEAELAIDGERAERCSYRLAETAHGTLFAPAGARALAIEVAVRAEQASFEVALASCLAKYAREVAMHAFNAHFAALDGALRPTAGYVQDARRWLRDAEPCLRRAGLSTEELVRTR
ncbi:MAG: hypothetical protein EPO68_06080 [Planctomycetota bacterium]|nr:MAG: hypothetical protein EPO68_06080 [Planctomycetota bacterium]